MVCKCIYRANVPSITAQAADAAGLQHQQHGSISHPHNMSFTFNKGSNSQLASNMLVTQAEGTDLKDKMITIHRLSLLESRP